MQAKRQLAAGSELRAEDAQALQVLGLSERAARVYAYLVGHPGAGPGAVAAGCDLAPDALTAEVDVLVATGLVRRDPAGAAQVKVVAPEVALEALIQDHEDRLRLGRLVASKLVTAHRTARSTSSSTLMETVTGLDNVEQVLEQVQRVARSEVRVLSRPPYALDPTAPNEVERVRLAQAVAYRTVLDSSALTIPGLFETLRTDMRRGEQTKVFAGVPIKLVLADASLGLIALDRPEMPSAEAILVHPSELLRSLSEIFELVWRFARPAHSWTGGWDTVEGLDRDHLRLLELLGNGMTDEAIARSLGCSLRTVQRRVRTVLRMLGADTRLQAGAAAAKRGLL